jgi:hypothetical protein
MGRSMTLPSQTAQLDNVTGAIAVFEKKLNRYFKVFRRGDNIYQSEYGLDSNGEEIFNHSERVDYVIGAGQVGFTCVVRRANYLLEAPLSFYSTTGTWELSPGYDSQDYGFARPILPGCVACHSGLPQPVPNRDGKFMDPPFRELSIGCENCHGPGELHVAERARGLSIAGEVDSSIVNPEKLAPWLADNICMSCHEGEDARILQPGKQFANFRPGTPLDNTVAIFKIPISRQPFVESPLLDHYSSMILSRCYRETRGQFSCQTCHDPHYQPLQQDRPGYFRRRCLACHSEHSCRAPLPERLNQNPPDSCAGCHMPKQVVQGISHAALTSHRVVAYGEEPYPEAAFHQTTAALPDLVHVDAIPGEETVPPHSLTLLQAYQEIMNYRPGAYRQQYDKLLDRLANTEPGNPVVLSALARRALTEGSHEGLAVATRYFLKAIDLGSASSSDFLSLSELLARSGKTSDAVSILSQGIALFPYTSSLYESLAMRYLSLGRVTEALDLIKNALLQFPQDSLMRTLLNEAQAALPAP